MATRTYEIKGKYTDGTDYTAGTFTVSDGTNGTNGTNGKSAITYLLTIETEQPVQGAQKTLLLENFSSQELEFNDTFFSVCKYNTDKSYIGIWAVQSVVESNVTCVLISFIITTGATGLPALVYSQRREWTTTPTVNATITFPTDSFNRTPVVGDVLRFPFLNTTTNKCYDCNSVCTAISGSNATFQYKSVVDITGIQGPKGDTGPQGPAGPLPNYVSFETPTSINISTNGNEVTYTGVAKFEADGSMESGEYHQVLPMPVEMLIPAPVTDPPVVGGTINLGSLYFNRQPLVNEYFLLRALSPAKNILTLAIAKCTERNGTNAVCEIKNKNDISIAPKKYAHNITIEAGNAVIGFTIFTSQPNAYTNALSVYANIGLSANQQIPASGVIGNNLPVYCIRMGATGLAAIAVSMSVTLDSDTEVKDIVVPL